MALYDRQNGAALVIVMALLAGAMLLGIAGAQSAIINEHLAGNYRIVAQANMNAESAYSKAVEENIETINWGSESYDQDDIEKMGWEEINDLGQVVDQCEEEASLCFYFPLIVNGKECFVAFGAVNDGQEEPLAFSVPFFLFID
tara:strand:+ start:1092 stop:1523 length:432 start_codon:yes stop_codon:yes gene_type:complete